MTHQVHRYAVERRRRDKTPATTIFIGEAEHDADALWIILQQRFTPEFEFVIYDREQERVIWTEDEWRKAVDAAKGNDA